MPRKDEVMTFFALTLTCFLIICVITITILTAYVAVHLVIGS